MFGYTLGCAPQPSSRYSPSHTGGTGIYQHVQGTFFSRISDEFQTVDFFGYSIDAPIWFNKSIVVFTLKKGD
jgi:hypothetical protein